MPLADVVNVLVLIGASPIGLAAFSVPLVAADLTTPQQTAFGSDDVREVTPATWRAVMDEVGVASNEDLYLSLRTMFQQPNKPALVLLGLRADPVAQVVTYTIPAVPPDGTYTITIDGVDCSFAASSSTQTEVRDGLITAVDAGPDTVDAAVGSASTLTVTALSPGRPFTSSISTNVGFSQATTTASVGLPEDLAVWQAERDDFYFVLETGHDEDDVIALAGAIEASSSPKLYIAQADDATAQTSSTTDVGNTLRLLAYARTAVIWHGTDDEFADAALVGRMATVDPGSATWANKELVGVPGIIPDSVTFLTNKNYTWLESYPSKGVSATRRARVADGTPIDIIIAADFARDLYQSRLFDLELSVDKIPYTRKGRGMIVGTVEAATAELASDRYEIANPDTVEITVPNPADLSDEDRSDRLWSGIIVAFEAQGAAESIDMTVNIAQAA